MVNDKNLREKLTTEVSEYIVREANTLLYIPYYISMFFHLLDETESRSRGLFNHHPAQLAFLTGSLAARRIGTLGLLEEILTVNETELERIVEKYGGHTLHSGPNKRLLPRNYAREGYNDADFLVIVDEKELPPAEEGSCKYTRFSALRQWLNFMPQALWREEFDRKHERGWYDFHGFEVETYTYKSFFEALKLCKTVEGLADGFWRRDWSIARGPFEFHESKIHPNFRALGLQPFVADVLLQQRGVLLQKPRGIFLQEYCGDEDFRVELYSYMRRTGQPRLMQDYLQKTYLGYLDSLRAHMADLTCISCETLAVLHKEINQLEDNTRQFISGRAFDKQFDVLQDYYLTMWPD